jgi:CHASE2 domain-containing sensor protein/signal transduction histidine kinase
MFVKFLNKSIRLLAMYVGAIVAVFAIWGIGLIGGFVGIDGLFYDYISRHPLTVPESNQKVLMVEIDDENQNKYNDHWINIITFLNKLGAKEIVFTFFPKDASAEFYQFVSQNPNVIFGRKTIPDPENLDQFILEPVPLAAKAFSIPFGIVQIPPSIDGVYRSQSFYTRAEGKTFPLLEVASADRFYSKTFDFKGDSYLINFQGGEESLSKINIERILSKDVIPELVNNKAVIIGFGKEQNEIGLHTPATVSNEMISLLAFQAFALDTLLNNSQINRLSDSEKLVLFTLIALLVIGICTILEIKVLIWTNAGLTLLFIGFAIVALQRSCFWVPIVEMLSMQYILLILFFRQKMALESKAIRKMVINLALELQERTYPVSFFNSPDYWSQVIVMIDQLFTLTRLIILERVSGDHRIVEIKALRCTLTDIHEKRRDYEREPYLSSIKKNTLCVVQGYFKDQKTSSEMQYLVPLIFSGEVLGFLAFGVETKTVELNTNFNIMIQEFSEKISELLYQAQVWKELHGISSSKWRNFKIFENESFFYNKLYKSISFLDKHLLVLENVFNSLSTATILYDLFGRMIKLNNSMSTLLQAEGILPFNITVLDLVVAISNMGYEEARQCLQYTVMQNKNFTVPAKFSKIKDQCYVLRIRALSHESRHAKSNLETNASFVVNGILLELINISEMGDHYKTKETLIKNIFYKMDESIKSMLAFSVSLKDKKSSTEQGSEVMEDFFRKLSELEKFNVEVEDFISKELEVGPEQLCPVDIVELTNVAIRKVSHVADVKKIKIIQVLSNIRSLVYGSSDLLVDLLTGCLTYLIEDAVENSELIVKLEEEGGTVTLSVKNKGFGIPKERFDNYFLGKEEASPQKLAEIFAMIPLVQDWGGELNAGCEVGVGTYFNLALKRFV